MISGLLGNAVCTCNTMTHCVRHPVRYYLDKNDLPPPIYPAPEYKVNDASNELKIISNILREINYNLEKIISYFKKEATK